MAGKGKHEAEAVVDLDTVVEAERMADSAPMDRQHFLAVVGNTLDRNMKLNELVP